MYSIRATYIPREDMHFDRDYYIKHHIPLAQKQLAGHVRYLQMHAEFDMHVLTEEKGLRSPCIRALRSEQRRCESLSRISSQFRGRAIKGGHRKIYELCSRMDGRGGHFLYLAGIIIGLKSIFTIHCANTIPAR